MSKQLNDISNDILKLDKKIAALSVQMLVLKEQQSDLESENFIKKNKIKLRNVELSDGKGKPYFLNARQFGLWLKYNSTKKWAEWNGRIFSSKDIIDGTMSYSKAKLKTLIK